LIAAVIWLAAIALLVRISVVMRRTRRRGGVGTAAAGAVYDWLNEDKRRAIEIIVEERAEARDPEDKDGNLPDLVSPKR
jgi:hypothetical protein